MLIYVPKKEVIENNNLFNCNLNTLEAFFPPSPFPLPRDTNLYSITDYFNPNNTPKYIKKFHDDRKRVGPFKIPKMYFDMMEKDLGIKLDKIPDIQPANFMFERYYDDILEQKDTCDLTKDEIRNICNTLFEYYIMADKNLGYAKLQLKGMRASVTAMRKRLDKQGPSYKNAIYEYRCYLKSILDLYEKYIGDKTIACKQIYLHLSRYVADYYTRTNSFPPDNLLVLMNDDIIM